MTTKVELFGEIKLIKKNPWFSGKLLSAVKAGLAKPKKDYILASPPPWYGDPSKLSDAQLYQVLRFAKVAHETRKKPITERLRIIKAEASGATGLAKPKTEIEMPNIGKIITIARARGIPIPEGLPTAPVMPVERGGVGRTAPAVIRE